MAKEALTIALCIPHTPWVPARVESMQRLRDQLGKWDGPYLELTERASNKVWPVTMWRWALESGADYFLTLQDDVMVPPYFRRALDAMLPHLPPRNVLGLSAVHPMGVEIARQGHRWYRTRSWLVGWAMLFHRADLAEFVAWHAANPELAAQYNEDDLVNRWVHGSGRFTLHPVPTIADHDTSIESSYANDHHVHRRSSVTWRDFGEGSLCDPDFWLPSGTPKLLPVPKPRHCWFCLTREAEVESHITGASLCRHCCGQIAATLITGVPR